MGDFSPEFGNVDDHFPRRKKSTDLVSLFQILNIALYLMKAVFVTVQTD